MGLYGCKRAMREWWHAGVDMGHLSCVVCKGVCFFFAGPALCGQPLSTLPPPPPRTGRCARMGHLHREETRAVVPVARGLALRRMGQGKRPMLWLVWSGRVHRSIIMAFPATILESPKLAHLLCRAVWPPHPPTHRLTHTPLHVQVRLPRLPASPVACFVPFPRKTERSFPFLSPSSPASLRPAYSHDPNHQPA